MTSTLSPLQAKAADGIADWYNGGSLTPQIYRLFGYAGTGKSTTAEHILQQLDARFRSACFTGKAASVLRRKGVHDATTIHRLIYKPVIPSDAVMQDLRKRIAEEQPGTEKHKVLKAEWAEMLKPRFELRPEEDLEDIDGFLLDECSMIGEDLGADLLSYGKKILVLGDPAQLPPVHGGGYFTAAEPNILLTEIHRQAAGNPIIAMSNLVRQGRRLGYGSYGTSTVISRHAVNGTHYRGADQVIVGRNATRSAINKTYRDMLGFYGAGLPVATDKVICLKNNHELGILNGTQWQVVECEDEGNHLSLRLTEWDKEERTQKLVNVRPDAQVEQPEDWQKEDVTKRLRAHLFNADLKEMTYFEQKRYEQFDFGYAITCHKAQGSQWDKVFIQNESYCFKNDAARWLYTAITRAAQSVTIAL